MRSVLRLMVLLFAIPAIAHAAAPVSYTLRIDASDLSVVHVAMRFASMSSDVRIAMAAHPEYNDRYYRYIENVTATAAGRPLTVAREGDAVWNLQNARGQVSVKYDLRLPRQENPTRDAWKPFLTPTGGMVGDLHCLMYVVGGEDRTARLVLDLPAGWKAAGGLNKVGGRTFTGLTEVMLDSPVMVGKFDQWDFVVRRVPHQIVIWSPADAQPYDAKPLVDGVRKIAEQAVRAFGGPPYQRYTFLFDRGGQAGLEHLTSVNVGLSNDSFDGVLEQTAHEYTHVWNLVDVRPRERVGVSYKFAEPASTLWWNEGATIMFADLLLRRAGLPTERPTRKAHLEGILARYFNAPGYGTMSAELVSKGDTDPLLLGDNTTSTHLQGEVLATMLDLKIRDATNGRRNTTDAMRLLAERYDPHRGITNRDIESALENVCRCSMGDFFQHHIYGAGRVDTDRYLALIGLKADVTWGTAVAQDGTPAVDLRVGPLPGEGALRLRISNSQSAWGKAGLHTGDKLLTVNGKPTTNWTDLRTSLRTLKVGDVALLEVESGGQKRSVEVHIVPYEVPTVHIRELPDAAEKQLRLRRDWIDSN